MMLSLIPAVGTLLGAVTMFLYPLNEKAMTKISSELTDFRKNE
jgi:Na+/melibiose symporter-like transporter